MKKTILDLANRVHFIDTVIAVVINKRSLTFYTEHDVHRFELDGKTDYRAQLSAICVQLHSSPYFFKVGVLAGLGVEIGDIAFFRIEGRHSPICVSLVSDKKGSTLFFEYKSRSIESGVMSSQEASQALSRLASL